MEFANLQRLGSCRIQTAYDVPEPRPSINNLTRVVPSGRRCGVTISGGVHLCPSGIAPWGSPPERARHFAHRPRVEDPRRGNAPAAEQYTRG